MAKVKTRDVSKIGKRRAPVTGRRAPLLSELRKTKKDLQTELDTMSRTRRDMAIEGRGVALIENAVDNMMRRERTLSRRIGSLDTQIEARSGKGRARR